MKLVLKRTAEPSADLPKPHPRVDRGERRFDKTQLHEDQHGKGVHRDYAAHYFRWGFAKNFIKKGVRSLEVGCGQDMPLVKVLFPSMSNIPDYHLAVDLNKISKPAKAKWLEVKDEFNFVDDWKQIVRESFNVVTCFEVIEHMQKPDGVKLMKGIHEMMAKDAVALISTPVYNGKHMAANHIHEYGFKELRELFVECGFTVVQVHGTFMTSQSMKKVMTQEERKLIDQLHQFYSWDVLANFLAPKYPEASSNCCWVLKRSEDEPPF